MKRPCGSRTLRYIGGVRRPRAIARMTMLNQIRQPIRVQTHRRLMPVMRQFSFSVRKIQHHVSSAVAQRSSPELVKFRRRLIIEICARQLGIPIDFARDEFADVSAIFAEQCLRVVLRMALKVYRETPPLPDEHIRAYLRRSRYDGVVFGD